MIVMWVRQRTFAAIRGCKGPRLQVGCSHQARCRVLPSPYNIAEMQAYRQQLQSAGFDVRDGHAGEDDGATWHAVREQASADGRLVFQHTLLCWEQANPAGEWTIERGKMVEPAGGNVPLPHWRWLNVYETAKGRA